jgi:general nucleoside transport system ATP-binding protein
MLQADQTSAPVAPARNVVELIGVTKTFPGLVANDAVDLNLRAGEVHALLGENGAGKSTLMNILTGIYQPDEGEIRLNGAKVHFTSPMQAIAAGIGMVHQHFKLIKAFTVAENIHLGWGETPRRVNAAELERRTMTLAKRFGLDVRPDARVEDLSAGEQQRVEILRVLSRGARVLILDEPTAVLTPPEAIALARAVREFTATGYAVIFISHKLDEVLEIADRITVLRAGRNVTTLPAAECTHARLATLMVGREIVLPHGREEDAANSPGPVVLQLFGVSALNEQGMPALKEVNLAVRAGEIVGIAGVAGNGQRELTEVLTGTRLLTTGEVRVRGKTMNGASPAEFLEAGIGHVPEDRLRSGLAPSMAVADNAVLREYRRPPIARGPLFIPSAVRVLARRIVDDANVIVPNMRAPVRNLSGGNQQRLVARREMRIADTALVAAYPTRGLDVGAIDSMLRYLIEMRDRGVGVLLVSEELEELLSIADRVAVMFQGRIMGIFAAHQAEAEKIGLLMGGRADAIRAEAAA